MNTFMAKDGQIERKWYVVDATGLPLGRLASQVAAVLRGKNKPTFTPNVDTGDHVIIINSDKVVLTGKKLEKKWFSVIQALDITQFWVSQMSTKQNATLFEDKKKPAVTDFDIHNMDIILKLSASKADNIDVKKITYQTIQGKKEDITKYIVKVDPGSKQYTKNRYGQNMDIDLLLWRGHKIINAFVARNLLTEYGYLTDLGQKKSFAMSPELAEFLGEEALEYAGIKDIEKVPRKPNLNKLCSKYEGKLIEFIKAHGLFKMKLEEEKAPEEEDDGLF